MVFGHNSQRILYSGMMDIPKPVLSCFGHESLVSELESQLMQSIASEPVLWRYSKWTPPYPVHINVYFTRFDAESFQAPVKVLSTGRPIRPLGSMKPFLYIHVLSNNNTQYTHGTVKQDIAKWLGHLNAQNIKDWLFLMIDADSQLGASKMWSKSNVLDRIKQDFHVPTSGHHFLRVPDRRAVEEKVFSESWSSLMRALRKILLDIFHQTIEDYQTHIRLLLEAQGSIGWNFFEYLDRKEELAELYLFLRGYEDSLHEYYDIESLFSSAIRNTVSGSSSPGWIEHLTIRSSQSASTCSFLSCFPVINSALNSHQTQAVRNRTATLFDIRTYLLSKQSILLKSLRRLHEFPALALSCMVAAIQESKTLKVCSVPEFECCWTLLCILDCLQLIRPKAVNSEDSMHAASSIAAILAVPPESPCHRSGQPVSTTVPYFTFQNELGNPRSLENVFLYVNHSANPLAEPLAKLIARTHAIITPIAASPEHLFITEVHGRRQSFNSYLVDMWTMVLLQLTFLGQRLSFWLSSHDHTKSHSVLQSIKASINHCSLSHFTTPDDFAVSVHRHLNHLLSSRTIYSEIYISLAQVIVGLMHLISQPRKSVYVSCLLANFLQCTNCAIYASDLYSHAVSVYLNENWISLSLRTYLQLACCLRMLIDDKRFQHNCELESVIIRYVDCCFALGCASHETLFAVVNSMNVAASQKVLLNTWFPDELITPVTELHSREFWWSELVRTQHLLHEPVLFDASSALSTPFRIGEIHLKAANRDGTQCLTLQLNNTSDLSFRVRMEATAALPSTNDWLDLMEYGFMGGPKCDVDEVGCDLTVVDYTQSVPPIIIDLSPNPHSMDSRHAISLIPRPEPIQMKSGRSEADISGSPILRKRSSFLNVAASWAARPTWKSQDQLHSHGRDFTHSPKTPAFSGVREGQSFHLHPPSVSPTIDPSIRNFTDSNRVSRFSLSQAASTSNLQNNNPSSIDSVTVLDRTQEIPFLRLSSCVIQTESAVSFVLQKSSDCASTIILHPGVNTVDLVATCPGFMLPVCLRLSILDWFSNENSTSRNTLHCDNVQLDLSYTIQRHHFSSSWKNHLLLDSLLPSLRNCYSVCESFEPITVILGLKQPILFEIKLGKLGLSTQSCSAVTLRRSRRRMARNHSSPTGVTEATRKTRGFSDYTVIPLTECSTNVTDSDRFTNDQLTNDFTDSECILLDGPVDLLGKSLHLTEFANGEYFPADSQLQMTRPLLLSVLTEMDEFAISTPLGYMHPLPVRIVKPLALQLNVSTFQRTNAVIFGLRIGCTDLSHQLTTKLGASNESPVFMLSEFQMTLSTPSVQEEPKTGDTPTYSRTDSVVPRQVLSPQSTVPYSLGEPLTESCHLDKLDTLVGVLVDPNCNALYVSPLCPVALLWHFKFSEFRPFMNATRERFNKSPVAKFQCNFQLLGNTDSKARLVFCRKISPVSQPKIGKPAVTNRFLGRNKKGSS